MMQTWVTPLRLWCAVESRLRADADERGQGTVEYVGLVVAVALLLTAVSTQLRGGGGIDDKIVAIVKGAVEKVGKL
jgi:Flp pilus assembly pilin Flp